MPGVPLALCEREEIFCALVEDPTNGLGGDRSPRGPPSVDGRP